ncbi:MAG TPA: hypothetical protein VMT86_16805 [Bryobacteraceae bacterium]|nr:hypothetical protein [Bryobacteraceae bacterium]
MTSTTDSRSYAFAFLIRAAEDLPADFDLPRDLPPFSCGVFLPQAAPDWYGRRAYPPRVLLLSPDRLTAIAHRASGEAAQTIPLRDLRFVEYGHFLLSGWITFATPEGRREFRFNTRTSRPVEEWLRALSRQWAPAADGCHARECVPAGSALSIKFRNAESAALDPDEHLVARFFHTPAKVGLPADYVGITNRRLIWITDRNRGRCERFGWIVRWAPLTRRFR